MRSTGNNILYIAPDQLKKKREEIEELKKRQAEEAEKQRKQKEQERRKVKETQNKWLQAGIDTKAKINKSLDINQKELVSKTKGKGMSDCIFLWKNPAKKAGDYDKKGYLNQIKGINGIDDPNYEILAQINAAVNNNKDWKVLKEIIECLL